MTAPCSSGLYDMPAECLHRGAGWSGLLGGLVLAFWAGTAAGAEAVMPEIAPVPVPVEAEAAHQDLRGDDRTPGALDEAIFTEITPLTIPEIGIALPPDQEL